MAWRDTRLEARIWWCGDDSCDCTQPVIERITPNLRAGPPWVRREVIWEGEFLSGTCHYGQAKRESLQYAPLREACQRLGVLVPASVSEQGCAG